jgi:hypothetical protein
MMMLMLTRGRYFSSETEYFPLCFCNILLQFNVLLGDLRTHVGTAPRSSPVGVTTTVAPAENGTPAEFLCREPPETYENPVWMTSIFSAVGRESGGLLA